jgi:hypothetical protein
LIVMHTAPAKFETTLSHIEPSGVRQLAAPAAAAGARLLPWQTLERESANAARARKVYRHPPVPRGLDPEHPLMGPHPTD